MLQLDACMNITLELDDFCFEYHLHYYGIIIYYSKFNGLTKFIKENHYFSKIYL